MVEGWEAGQLDLVGMNWLDTWRVFAVRVNEIINNSQSLGIFIDSGRRRVFINKIVRAENWRTVAPWARRVVRADFAFVLRFLSKEIVDHNVLGSFLKSLADNRWGTCGRLRLVVGTLLLSVVHEIESLSAVVTHDRDLLIHRLWTHLWHRFVFLGSTASLLPDFAGDFTFRGPWGSQTLFLSARWL